MVNSNLLLIALWLLAFSWSFWATVCDSDQPKSIGVRFTELMVVCMLLLMLIGACIRLHKSPYPLILM